MKVKDLMELLDDHDPEMEVMVDGYEGGFSKLEEVVITTVKEVTHRNWWYGEYDEGNKLKILRFVRPLND